MRHGVCDLGRGLVCGRPGGYGSDRRMVIRTADGHRNRRFGRSSDRGGLLVSHGLASRDCAAPVGRGAWSEHHEPSAGWPVVLVAGVSNVRTSQEAVTRCHRTPYLISCPSHKRLRAGASRTAPEAPARTRCSLRARPINSQASDPDLAAPAPVPAAWDAAHPCRRSARKSPYPRPSVAPWTAPTASRCGSAWLGVPAAPKSKECPWVCSKSSFG